MDKHTKHLKVVTPAAVREYSVGGMRYIVKATISSNATEDARAKVRRLIRGEIGGQSKKTAQVN
jgi:hypothetical protein